MKALIYEKYGRAGEVLQLSEVPEREPGEGEVKVKILLSPVNPSDIYNTIERTYEEAVGKAIWNYGRLDGKYDIDPQGTRSIPALPHIPGLEGVGIVVKAGKGLWGKFLLGKRVVVIGAKTGNWQQFNVVSAAQVLPIGKQLSDEQAATFFVNPLSAYLMSREVLKCRSGDVLLQSAANSELGKMVIRLGKKYGFQTINLIRNKEQELHLKSIGATHVIDIKSEDLRQRVYDITDGKGVAYALDPIGGELASNMIQCLGMKGHMLVYGTLTRDPLQFSPRDLMTPLTRIEGFFLTNWLADQSMLKKLGIIRRAGKLIKKGILKSEIGPVYPIEEFRSALEVVNNPGNKGKVLLRMNER